jgi:hypothetical protein
VRWPNANLVLRLYTGQSGRFEHESVLRAVESALRLWTRHQVPCTAVDFVLEMDQSDGLARDDGVNSIVFETQAWCPPDAQRKASRCYPENMMAATILRTGRPVAPNGETAIREVDILLNAVAFDWTGADSSSLARVVGHEIGHALGLADACSANWVHSAANGRSCARAQASDRSSMMFPALEALPSRIRLSGAERGFLCEVYPMQ